MYLIGEYRLLLNCSFLRRRRPPSPTLFPYTTLFQSSREPRIGARIRKSIERYRTDGASISRVQKWKRRPLDRKSTRLNSSHRCISYAVFCLKKKIQKRKS